VKLHQGHEVFVAFRTPDRSFRRRSVKFHPFGGWSVALGLSVVGVVVILWKLESSGANPIKLFTMEIYEFS
jgi:hypothetical protein